MLLFVLSELSNFLMNKSLKYGTALGALIITFMAYNTIIYTSDSAYGKISLSKKAQQGENIWLQNNCNACHQLYGLGGYLGPDLTNEYSRVPNQNYLKAMFNSGVKTMPQFHFNTKEKEMLIQFLKEVDQTGYYPNNETKIGINGWVSLKYKNLQYEK